MKTVEEREKIRRAYYLEEKSRRQIAQELGISRNTVRSALDGAVGKYTDSSANFVKTAVQK